MKSTLKGLGRKFRSNPTGQGSHPGNRKIVKAMIGQPRQLGHDGFAGRQSKPRVSIRGGQSA